MSSTAQEHANTPENGEQVTLLQWATAHQHLTAHHGRGLPSKPARREAKTSKQTKTGKRTLKGYEEGGRPGKHNATYHDQG